MNPLRCAVLALAAALLSLPALAQKSMLKTGEFLKTNEYLVADNKQFFAIAQGDGNFCVYKGSGPGDNKGYAYCSKNAGAAGQYFAVLQGDGNFCVYKGTGPGDNKGFVSCTGVAPGTGQYFAIVQGDGNFVVYRGTGPGDNKGLVWDAIGASKSGSGGAKAFFTDVGNWFVGAGNVIGDAFKGKLKSRLDESTLTVGKDTTELTVTGKKTISQLASKGSGAVELERTDSGGIDGKYVDVVNNAYTYKVTPRRAGPVTLVFSNPEGKHEVSLNVLPAPPLPPPAPAFTRATGGSVLTTNQFLRDGDVMVADNKSHFVMLQGDGNFCEYRGSGPGDNKGNVYCFPGRNSGAGPYFAAVQADANFCVYRGTGPGDNKGVVACTNTARGQGAYFMTIQSDGNLVIYAGTGPGDNKGLVWKR